MFLGYFCKQICYRELLKIAQSGHNYHNSQIDNYHNLVEL